MTGDETESKKENSTRRSNGSGIQRPCSCRCFRSSWLCSSSLSDRCPVHERTRQRCRRRGLRRSRGASSPAPPATASEEGFLAESPTSSSSDPSRPTLPLRPPRLLGPRQRRRGRRPRVRPLLRDLAHARQVRRGRGPGPRGRARAPGAAVALPRGAAVRLGRGRFRQPGRPVPGAGVAPVARGDPAGERERGGVI